MDDEARAIRALTLATRTAVAMLGPGDDAREVAQEVATRVLEKRSQLRDPEKFDAWVHTIAARETLRVRRRQVDRPWEERDVEAPDRDEPAHLDARAALERLGERERLAIRGGHIAYGRTQFGGDGVIVAADGIGFEGPFPIESITGGTAWGYTKRTLTAITPDDVTAVRVTYRDTRKATFIPRDNVVIAALEGPTPIRVRYVR